MIYLVEIFRWPLLLAFLLGGLTGWLTRAREGRSGIGSTIWFALALLVLAGGALAAGSQVLEGRAALALESALLHFGCYLAGAGLARVASSLRLPRPKEAGKKEAKAEPVRIEPVLAGSAPATGQPLRPLPFQGLAGLRAKPLPPPLPLPSASFAVAPLRSASGGEKPAAAPEPRPEQVPEPEPAAAPAVALPKVEDAPPVLLPADREGAEPVRARRAKRAEKLL